MINEKSINKSVILIVALCCLFTGCGSLKKTAPAVSDLAKLEGSWQLNYISGHGTSLDSLYPGKKPSINFDIKQNMVSGNTSCNNFTGKLNVEGNKINFNSPIAMTKMMCMDGNAEQLFLTTLQKVNKWSVTGEDTLNFMTGDIAVMRFAKIKTH